MTMVEASDNMITFQVTDQSDVFIGNRRIREAGLLAGASDMDRDLVATMISELGSNIFKYAQRGSISVSRSQEHDAVDIHICAQDQGPGIANVELAMTDHFSTGRTLGLGLPGVRRMSDTFSIQSSAQAGTRVSATKRIKGPRVTSFKGNHTTPVPRLHSPVIETTSQWDIGMRTRPMRGEVVCGDMTMAVQMDNGILLVIADATGHGKQANELTNSLSQFVLEHATNDVKALLTAMHAFLKGSIGAAVGALFVDTQLRTLTYAGVGNTGAARRSGESWRPVSKDGVLGQRLPTLFEQKTQLAQGDLILMWSDGLSELASGMFATRNAYKSSAQLTHELLQELGKPHDDASCIVLRWLP
jgi:anti-sigma regulatory factor (Ser/Thr protein kinase)